MRERISRHINYKEATRSDTALRLGIDNTPSEVVLDRMVCTANCIFEPLRKGLGNHPIRVTSFYRSAALNKAIGGAKYSSHMYGRAIDLKAIEGTPVSNRDIFFFILKHLCFNRLIWEYGDDENPDWVHVDFTSKRRNRNIALVASRKNNRTVYKKFKI
jgi:hypothetical protein